MKLHLGKMSNKELAEWFDIKESSFKSDKKNKLQILKKYADFYEEKGKVIITYIYNDEYSKKMTETYELVDSKFEEYWSDNGLDSCSRVSGEMYDKMNAMISVEDSTFYNYVRKIRNDHYGVPFSSGGKMGRCIYLWAKRDKETGKLSFLTDAELKIKNALMRSYFGDTTEASLLIEEMIEANEIKEEEAWGLYRKMTNLSHSSFHSFLKALEKEIGSQVVRGTLIERNGENAIEEKAPWVLERVECKNRESEIDWAAIK